MFDEIRYCNGCHARIVWVFSPKGKRMPLDVDPRPDGIFAFVPGTSQVRFVRPGDRAGRNDLYMAHHVTCPKSALYRQSQSAPKPSSHRGGAAAPTKEESR